MKHTIGNGPKCIDCRFYLEKSEHDGCRYDGWCHCKKQLRYGANGHKRENPPAREPVRWMWDCNNWEDADYPHINHFEAVTRKPDPNRKGFEQDIIIEAIANAVEEQRRERNDQDIKASPASEEIRG